MTMTKELERTLIELFSEQFIITDSLKTVLLNNQNPNDFLPMIISFSIGGMSEQDAKTYRPTVENGGWKSAMKNCLKNQYKNQSDLAQEVVAVKEETGFMKEWAEKMLDRVDARDAEIKDLHSRELSGKKDEIRGLEYQLENVKKELEDTKAKLSRARDDAMFAKSRAKKAHEVFRQVPAQPAPPQYVTVRQPKRGIIAAILGEEEEVQVPVPAPEPQSKMEKLGISSEELLAFIHEVGDNPEYSEEVTKILMDAIEKGIPYSFIREFISPSLSPFLVQAMIDRYDRLV